MLCIDGERIPRATATPDDIERAIAAAVRAQEDFARWPAHRRAALCASVSQGLAARREELARLVVAEVRKPLQYARAEVDRAVATFAFAADEARRPATGEIIGLDAAAGGEGRIGLVRRVPRGPVAAITPFNFPLNLVAHKLAPALACGAPVLLKPAPEAPGCAAALAELVHAAGAPPGAFALVPCDVATAAPLVEDERVRVLSFTGSAAVGWSLRARAGSKQVLLELGGNAAAIVCADADLDAALPRLVAAGFAYAGQICISLQRVFVDAGVHDAFVARFVDATRRLAIVGDPADERTVVGPLIRARDADRVMRWIDEAVAAGARVLCGGTRRGDVIEPTLLAGTPPGCSIAREEAFGPVVLVDPVRDLDEAIARVNDSPYGLQASVYTGAHAALMRAFAGLRVGAVIHDDAPSFRVDHMPYGGSKRSGLGREGLRWSIEEYTEPRMLVTRAG
jgi:acyl-CoA reductase-like NAD-dependent aldehyde dehydrogenase